MSEWRPIEEAPKDGIWRKVDLWLEIGASPRSMGFSDSFRVPDCWFDEKLGGWVHHDRHSMSGALAGGP